MFLSDKFCQSIKKFGQFARFALYHIFVLLVAVAYPDVEQPFKGFRQVHQIDGLSVLINNVFGEEQTAYHFHDVDKGCFVGKIKRGKGLFVGALLQLFRILDTPFNQAYFCIQNPYCFINKIQTGYFFSAQTVHDTI